MISQFKLVVLGPTALTGLMGRGVCDAVLVMLTALCLTRALVRPHQRAAWVLIGLGLLAWSFGEIYYNAAFWTVSTPPVPSLADAGYLSFYPFVLAGLFLLLRDRAACLSPLTWVDGATTAISVGALSAAIVFQQVVRHDSGAPVTFANGNGGTLLLNDSMQFNGLVAGFSGSAQIDLADIPYEAGTTTFLWTQAVTNANASGTLTVSEGANAANITLLGQYSQTSFALAGGAGGTVVTSTSMVESIDGNAPALANAQHG